MTDRKSILIVTLSQADSIFHAYRDTKVELYEVSGRLRKIIDKIPEGHELFVYREHLMQKIPDLDDLR